MESTAFFTLDAESGYWQVENDNQDENKTVLTSCCGLYGFTKMLFGMKSAPGTFQQAIDKLLLPVKWQNALVYVDDIMIFSKTLQESITHVKQVLTLLRKAGVRFTLKKRRFSTKTIHHLSRVTRPQQLELSLHTTHAV